MPVNTVTAVHSDALISTFDFHKPSIQNKLFRKFGDQGQSFFNIINTWGYVSPVTQTEYSHFTEEFIHETVKVNANVAAPGAGVAISFVLHPDSRPAVGGYFIQVNDDVMFANGVTGNVTAINTTTHTITVAPHDVLDNIGALTAGDEVVIYSNNYAEGTDQPDGHVSKATKHTFSTKIIKYSTEYTGTEITNETWFNVTSDGQPVQGSAAKGQLDADYEMMLRMDQASLFDKPTTNTALKNAGKRTMTGIVPWVRTGGNVDNYTPNFYSVNNFNQMDKKLDAQFGASENVMMSGISHYQEIEDMFVNSFDNGAIMYGDATGKKGVDVHIDFRTFTKSGRTYHMKKMGVFSHPKLGGAPGYKLPATTILMPMDTKKDSVSGNYLPSVGIRYKEMNGYSRKMETFVTGGAKARTNSIDKDKLNMRTERGTELIGNNRFFIAEA
jgi:hypothetical protein